MFGLSLWELGMVLVVALVFLGPKRLPELARTIGSGLRTLRRASSDLRGALAEPLKEVQEPLDEIKNELYQTVSHFESEVQKGIEESADSKNEESLPSGDISPESMSKLIEASESNRDEQLPIEDDEGRIEISDPFSTEKEAISSSDKSADEQDQETKRSDEKRAEREASSGSLSA